MSHPTTEHFSYLSLGDFLPKSMTQFENHNYIVIDTNYERFYSTLRLKSFNTKFLPYVPVNLKSGKFPSLLMDGWIQPLYPSIHTMEQPQIT